MNTYELTYIIPVKAEGDDVAAAQLRVDGILTKNEAKKSSIQNGFTAPQKKRLGYEIGVVQYGYYTTVYFDADAKAMENISKELKADNGILRFLIVSVKGEIPQGVVISKKEVEQQVDEAVENVIKEVEESKNQTGHKEEKEAETKPQPELEESGIEEEKEEGVQGKKDKKDRKSKEDAKAPKKASLEELDEKLDEILGK